jgi:hypothetical protein
MIKRYILSFLILIMLAPLNVGASAWVAQSFSAVDADETLVTQMHAVGHDHQAMTSSGQTQSMMDAHNHSAEDCDDYCMTCSNHSSSSAVTSFSNTTLELDRKFSLSSASYTLSRAYLLYRPPIRV